MNTIILIIVLLGRKPIHADYSALNEEFESSHNTTKFKFGDRIRITKYKNMLIKRYVKNWSRETFVTHSVLKTNAWTYKIKDLNKFQRKKSWRY